MASSFWQTAMGDTPASRALGRLTPLPEPQPEAVAEVDYGSMSVGEYAAQRAVPDAFGESHWSRESRAWQPPEEVTELDVYAVERELVHRMPSAPDTFSLSQLEDRKAAQWAAQMDRSPRKHHH